MRSFPCLALLMLSACSPKPAHFEGATMATTWRVTIADSSDAMLKQTIQHRLDELETIFSNWRIDSPVSRWNASTTTAFQPMPREVIEVMQVALQISEQCDGAMDVTISPLINLWGFGPDHPSSSPPTAEQIAEAKSRCGWRKLQVQTSPPMLRKLEPNVTVNLSTLVEGYAADQIAALLESKGCHRFLIDVGGAIVARGQSWNVGLQTPNAPTGEALGSVPLQDMAVTTAGTYRKHREFGGRRFPHIIDPTTGRPVQSNLVSVSVFHERAVVADGWDTALLVLGPERGRALAQRLGLRAVFVTE